MYILSNPSQSMGFHVLGRQPNELLVSLATSNSIHYYLLVTLLFIFFSKYRCRTLALLYMKSPAQTIVVEMFSLKH